MLCLKMISLQGALLMLFVVSTLEQTDLVTDCKTDGVVIKWRPVLSQPQKVEPSKAHLGSCSPSSLAEDVLVFFASLHDCGFIVQVSEDKVTYTNVLTYGAHPDLLLESVECTYDISGKKSNSDSTTYVFNLELMNNDFSGPAPSSMFTLGSRIAIKAEVEQQGLEPLQIFLQRCVLATAPDLTQASQLHTVVSNSGCLIESKEGNAAFLPRKKPSEICFYFEAFKFALGKSVYIHCELVAWDHPSFNVDKKACYYLKKERRWELLDDPYQSYICGCCNTACIRRSSYVSGTYTQKVIGPFLIIEAAAQHNASDAFMTEGMDGIPMWAVVVTVPLVLLLLAGAIATGYYLCFWRGGRIGYRPSRDLLTKY